MDREDVLRRGAAEGLGVFVFVFIGAGAIITATATQSGSTLTIALANGLALGIMITALGHISGGHLNPAVTFGFWATGRITTRMAGVYLASQLIGAIVASIFLRGIFDDRIYDGAVGGAPLLASGISIWEGLLTEIVLTFFLVLVVFATAVDARGAFKIVGGFAIGLTVVGDVLVGGPLTGAAMNPARAFGPQLISWTWSDAWVYWVGPLIGGALAAGTYASLYLDRPIDVIGRPGTGVDEAGIERAERDLP